MASKKTKAAAAADDNLDELFSGITNEPKPKKSNLKSKPTSAASKAIADKDILADLESELASEQPSRPHTPRVKDVAARRSTATPPAVDDKPAVGRKSTDSARSLRTTLTPSATSSEAQEPEKKTIVEPVAEEPAQSGGGWWGGFLSTASAAMKQAEAAVSQIQQTEEAKKWTEQVKGLSGGLGNLDVNALRTYGDELRHRALPTFTNILHTLAPPISSHERLLIHITHDLVGYPSLDPLIHTVFSRVMSQVEGGDLLVVQRGQESSSRRNNESLAGWRDGPWWRQADSPRELGLINGLIEGTKLCRAGAESHANEYFAANGGVEQAKIRATEDLSESNPVRTSDLFLSVQAICVDSDKGLFAPTASAKKGSSDAEEEDEDEEDEELICFAVYILDPVHDIEFSTVSQSVPARWVQWLDAPTPLTPRSGEEGQEAPESVPEEIKDIIESGGVDPREWVAEWLEELLDLSIGVVAQRYVARRMGVGEGGLGKGKRRMEELVQEGGGEAARAGII